MALDSFASNPIAGVGRRIQRRVAARAAGVAGAADADSLYAETAVELAWSGSRRWGVLFIGAIAACVPRALRHDPAPSRARWRRSPRSPFTPGSIWDRELPALTLVAGACSPPWWWRPRTGAAAWTPGMLPRTGGNPPGRPGGQRAAAHAGGPAIGYRLAEPPLLVPVLRAGLGMVDAAQALMPEAQMGFVGVARNEETHRPVPYMQSLPESLTGRPVFVLDPMLATGGSMEHTIRLLTERGTTDVSAICVLAAPEGIDRLRGSGLPVRVVTASVDERLNDSAYIVPGLGDAGDRLFGAV